MLPLPLTLPPLAFWFTVTLPVVRVIVQVLYAGQ